MKTSNLNKSLLLVSAGLMLTFSSTVWAQTSLTPDGPAEMNMTTPEQPATTAPSVPSNLSPTTTSSDTSADPAVSAVLDRLKQDSTPLSVSDMSAAQDALARLNLLNEIEQKLAQIEETRQKRQLGSFGSMSGMGALPLPTGSASLPMPKGGNFPGFGAVTDDGTPSITAITGAGGNYHATLSMDGRTINVKNGSILPDGSKVTNISADGVSVSKKGKTSKLSFSQADNKQE